MAQIFRTDASIHPLRTTESESAAGTGAETMEGAGDVLVTLDLFESNDVLLSDGSDFCGTDTQSNDFCEASTSGCSTALSTAASTTENSRRGDPLETTNYEATLGPARRLAMLRKRKQRATAAARLDNTLSGFVNWVQRNTESNNLRRNARDEADKWFHHEVISNLRVASRSLEKLTDFITSTSCDCSGKCSKTCTSDEVKRKGVSKKKVGKKGSTGPAARVHNSQGRVSDMDSDSIHSHVSENDTDSELDGERSQSLLESESLLSSSAGTSEVTHSTPSAQPMKDSKYAALNNSASEVPQQSGGAPVACQGDVTPSPYLIVKSELEVKNADVLKTLVKRLRKKKIYLLLSDEGPFEFLTCISYTTCGRIQRDACFLTENSLM